MEIDTDNRKLLAFAYLVLFAWACLVSILGVIIFGSLFGDNETLGKTVVILFGLQVVLSFTIFLFARKLRCEYCRKHLFTSRHTNIHPKAVKFSVLSYWASSVINTIKNHETICIHCGGEHTSG